jgi:hypothetical protein
MSDSEASATSASSKSWSFLRSLRRRALASVGVLAGGMCAFVLYLAFLGTRFPWYQNLAVSLSILIGVVAIVIGLWISWGLSTAHRFAHFGGFDSWDG